MKALLAWFALIGLAGLLPMPAEAQGAPERELAAYLQAVRDAAIAGPESIRSNLVAINAHNPDLIWNKDHSRLLVVTWKSRRGYEAMKAAGHAPASEEHLVWVTAAPQVRNFCRSYMARHPGAGSSELALRLKQYLGLDPDWHYGVFVEMWVDPHRMFRPCVNPGIDDTRCDLRFGATTPVVPGIADYPAFYRRLYFSDFRYAPGVPWTGLGYTYDWGHGANVEGASEFVLVPGSAYAIRHAVPTAAYCTDGR